MLLQTATAEKSYDRLLQPSHRSTQFPQGYSLSSTQSAIVMQRVFISTSAHDPPILLLLIISLLISWPRALAHPNNLARLLHPPLQHAIGIGRRSFHSRKSLTARQSSSGFTLDPCDTDADCVSPRLCKYMADKRLLQCDGADNCRCRPSLLTRCANSDICPEGEVCGGGERVFPLCLSESFLNSSPSTELITEPYGTGLTLEQCLTNADCQGDRECAVAAPAGFSECTRPGLPCVCVPPVTTDCEKSSDCALEEVCADYGDVDTFWMSILYVATDPRTTIVRGEALTAEPCGADEECKSPRTCSLMGEACDGRYGCTCEPKERQECSKAGTCGPREVCGKRLGTRPSCASSAWVNRSKNWDRAFPEQTVGPQTTTSPQTTTVTIPGHLCVGVHLLQHLDRKELAYETDEIGDVLCDSENSCATPEHIVIWRGIGMMMARYCEEVGCVRRRMKVNSPKYRRGLVVPSRTNGLVMSAFVARYGTRAEELVLGAAIRVGL